MSRPKVSFIIPIFNAERHLRRCLLSIRAQAYPQDLIEIIAADGGSGDSSIDIAGKFGATVVRNPKRLAEYGLQVGIRHASGDIAVIFAADNELHSTDWINRVTEAFDHDPECSAVWGPLRSGEDDPALNKYFELIQSDPMTFFMNKNIQYYLNDEKTEEIGGRYCFRVDPARPLVWGANGLALKRALVAPLWAQDGYLGDNDAFQKMVESGHNRVAYIPGLVTYHHHVGEIKDWVRKWKRNFLQHFLDKLETRNTNWLFVENFRTRLLLWMLYSTNPLVSGVHALYLCVRDRNPYWAYHPLLCALQTAVYGYLVVTTPKGRKTILRIAKGTVGA